MNTDLKQTLTVDETPEPGKKEDTDLAMRTTLVQPIPLSRHPDFTRTHYWEKLTSETQEQEPKRTAASYSSAGKTRVGLGPDDPIVQAVQAAKQQLQEAERISRERLRITEVAAPASPSGTKTVLLAAAEMMQLIAAHPLPPEAAPTSEADDPIQLPKRRLSKPAWLALAAAGALICAMSISSMMPSSSSTASVGPSIVKPRPQPTDAAPASPQTAAIPPATKPTAPDGAGPAQTTEKAAIDALFAGDYTLASRHYTALANSHPEQPAFSEAARILMRKAAANADAE